MLYVVFPGTLGSQSVSLEFIFLFQTPWDTNRHYIPQPAAKRVKEKQRDVLKNVRSCWKMQGCKADSTALRSSLKFLEYT